MKVGVLGGGQLGRMLGLAAIPLGMQVRFLDPSRSAPAAATGELIVGDYADGHALGRFAEALDVVTYEFENVPLAAVDEVARRVAVHPPRMALAEAQDRVAEKRCFQRLGIPTAPVCEVGNQDDLMLGIERIGTPAILKTRRMGYDGRGQAVIRTADDAAAAWDSVGGAPSVLEGFVSFERELSIISARALDGTVVHYPLVENHHRDGILRLSLAPAPGVPDELRQLAEGHARRLLRELEYVGVLAIELFQRGSELIANEMAPRVHNSGHWTIEGAHTSQFENHLRAIAGLPLGSAAARGHSAMVNIVGRAPRADQVLGVEGAHLHLYGKEPRPRRKIGHITVTHDSQAVVQRAVTELLSLVDAANESGRA